MTSQDNDPNDSGTASPERPTQRRRSVLKAAGIGATLPLFSGVASARGTGVSTPTDAERSVGARPPIIHSHFGYSGTGAEAIPNRLEPDEIVELHVDESKIDAPAPGDPSLTVEFGAFHFTPLGLAVEPGSIVGFDFHTPEHTATAYHPGQDRQQRVPDAVPAFSSTVNEHHGFWLYRFEEEGVYDLFCAPHEWGGMGMRIVVGTDPGPVIRNPASPAAGGGRPPLPMTAALLGTGLPPSDPDVGPPVMAPEHIVETGPITLDDLDINFEVTVSGPTPTA